MTWVGKVVPKDQRTVGLEGTAQPHPCCRLGAPPARAAQSPSMSSGTSRDGAPTALGTLLCVCPAGSLLASCPPPAALVSASPPAAALEQKVCVEQEPWLVVYLLLGLCLCALVCSLVLGWTHLRKKGEVGSCQASTGTCHCREDPAKGECWGHWEGMGGWGWPSPDSRATLRIGLAGNKPSNGPHKEQDLEDAVCVQPLLLRAAER